MLRLVGALALGVAAAGTVFLGTATTAWAGEGAIENVDAQHSTVQVLFSLPDLPEGTAVDLDTVEVTADGTPQEASADTASAAGSVRRVSMLTIDTSQSMTGDRFDAAKAAALSFIENAPDDVRIGLVSFADTATVVEQPTTDRDALRDAVDELSITRLTRLYDGIRLSLDTIGDGDEGSVLVLSDGRDTSDQSVEATLEAVEKSGARVDVVALEQTGPAFTALEEIATAGGGTITNSTDPKDLEALFAQQAQVLASQLLVTFDVPSGWDGGDANLEVSVDAAGETYTDSAFVRLPAAVQETKPNSDSSAEPLPADEPWFVVSKHVMIGGLVAVGVGVALLIAMMTGVFAFGKKATVTDRLAPYGLSAAGRSAGGPGTSPGVKAKAIDVTERALRSGGLDVRLAKKLDAAAMGMHAAEWLLLHTGIVAAAGFVGYVLSGNIVLAVIFLLAGAVVPWLYLSRKASKRIKQFNSQLADTLQLVSGSLSAGLSLTQSLDTVVREGSEPVASEFRRALVEQRLGVEVETALEGVASRMHSDDFSWVVMAVRIQREVGGNLAELLLTVAGTLRERDYLRRQVRTLSAEGRMSAWVLGGLPPAFFGYLMLVQPTYLTPMLTSSLGWMMLAAAGTMMTIGIVVLSKMAKVEV